MSTPEDKVLESRLREFVSNPLPPEVEARLRARLAEFRSRLNGRKTVAATPARRARLTAGWKLGLTCAAAGLLVAVIGLLSWPRTSLADVATAVLQQSWVRLRTASTGDGESELWYSPARNIVATRRPNWTTYQDYRLQVVDSYETKENVVYHAPIASWQPGARDSGAMVEALATLLQAERLPEQPLARLDFLGPRRTTMRVLDQRMEKITVAGHNWLDYRLTVADPGFEQPLRMLFRVDAATKLPALCRLDGQYGGKPATVETRFDYPERGPADLYDLGVPRTAQRVDRVPAGDLKHIMETIRAGRERMDDYRAVFVSHPDLPAYRWWLDRPIIVYRKGRMFRADYPAGGSKGKLAATKPPDQDEDLGKWWRERTEFFRYCARYVVRGTTRFTSDVKQNTRPDGTMDAEIVSVSSMEGPEFFPPGWSMWPEFACRPGLDLMSNAHMEPVLEMHPPDGPPGCVRVTIRHTSQHGRINEKGIGIPDGYRYWLDPQRDFIAVRTDLVVRDAAGQEKVIERTTVEETARSPQGVWYARKIRGTHPDPVGNEKVCGQVEELYVDFNVNLPDSLFEPPTPGKIR
jgi:hypothetical protein